MRAAADTPRWMNDLPDDILVAVASNLDQLHDLLNFRRVARRYSVLGDTELVWQKLCASCGYKWPGEQHGGQSSSCQAFFRDR